MSEAGRFPGAPAGSFRAAVNQAQERMLWAAAQRTGEPVETCGYEGCAVRLTSSDMVSHRRSWKHPQ